MSGRRAVRTLKPQPPPDGIYESSYTYERGELICRRLRNGESLRSICRADPKMPTEKTVWNWARAHPEFGEALEAAKARQREISLEGQAMRDHFKRKAKEQRRIARGWRPIIDYPTTYSPARAEAICLRLIYGESLTSICRDPQMPCVATVYNWLRRYPEFVEDYKLAKEMGKEWLEHAALGRAAAAPGVRALARMFRRAEREIAWISPKRYR